MKKYLYLIKKAKIKSWLKFWLLTKDQVKYILSEILEGFSFNLQNTVKRYFKIFNIFGNSVQDGTPTPTNPVTIKSVADDGTFTIDFEGQTENYNYTFITKPLRSLPNGVRDSLEDDGIHRRVGRVVLDGTENWSLNSSSGDSYRYWLNSNGFKNIFTNIVLGSEVNLTSKLLCNYFSQSLFSNTNIGKFSINNLNENNWFLLNVNISTLADFKTWLSTHNTEVLYELETEIIEPYTEEQQEQYNKIKELYTFDGTTNIYSTDVVPPYLQIQYYMKGE